MANIKRNKSGYYEKTITIGHRINEAGNEIPIKKRFYGKTLKELNQKVDSFKEAQKTGIENRKQFFGVLADGWITEFFLHDGMLKDSTKLRYHAAWQRTIKPMPFYNARLDEISAKTIQAAYNKAIATGTPISEIRQAHKLMRRFYRYVEAENLGRDITHSITIPKEKKSKANEDITVWTDEELKAILTGFDRADNRFRLRFLIVLAYYTGCRKSELLALTYDDISTDGIRITKTLAETTDGIKDGRMISALDVTDPKTASSIRTIPVDPVVMNELEIHKAWHHKEQIRNGYRSNYIFTTDSGDFLDQKDLDRALSRYYERIGVPVKSFHTYRHTYGSYLCKKGISIETASALMGHSNISTTAQYYVNVSEDAKREAAMTLRRVLGA